MEDLLENAERVELDENTIRRVMFPTKIDIIRYSDLSQTTSIVDLFRTVNIVFLLYQINGPNNGHWTLLYRTRDGIVHYFDPYGFPPDKPLSFAHYQVPDLGRLSQLMSEVHADINTTEYQAESDKIDTCGRWCIARAKWASKSDEWFQSVFSRQAVLAPDALVTLFTLIGSGDIDASL